MPGFWRAMLGGSFGCRRRRRFPRIAHAPLLAQSPAAQSGKEITIERLFRPPSLGGRLTQGIEWAPDGKRFSYLDRQGSGAEAVVQLWTMDAATGERKVLVNAETLKSVMQPEKAKTRPIHRPGPRAGPTIICGRPMAIRCFSSAAAAWCFSI